MHEGILLVDGNRETLELAQRVLRNERYDVRVAGSADEALQIAAVFRPRLILTDMRLPGSADALAMVRRLRAASATRAAIIVIVTTDASADEREAAMTAGCDDFIAQPLSTAMLRGLAAKCIVEQSRAEGPSSTGSTWMRRLFEPARRLRPPGLTPTYRAGTRLPAADHFAPRR